MSRTFIILLFIFTSLLLGVSKIVGEANNYATSKEIKKTDSTSQQQTIRVFIISKHTTTYDYLTSVKQSLSLTEIIEKVKKEYPNSDGIIVTWSLDTLNAVRFKE